MRFTRGSFLEDAALNAGNDNHARPESGRLLLEALSRRVDSKPPYALQDEVPASARRCQSEAGSGPNAEAGIRYMTAGDAF